MGGQPDEWTDLAFLHSVGYQDLFHQSFQNFVSRFPTFSRVSRLIRDFPEQFEISLSYIQ